MAWAFSYLYFRCLAVPWSIDLSLSHAFGLAKIKVLWDEGAKQTPTKNFIFKSALLLAISAFSFSCSSDDNQYVVNPTIVVTETKVTVTKIQISQIPQTDSNGLSWDFSSNPDIYVKLFDENNVLGYASNYLSDFMPSISSPITVTFSKLSTTNLSAGLLKVEVWDNDLNDSPSNADNKIGEATFYLYDCTSGANKYQPSAVKNVNGTLVTLYMTWE